jgi:non-specific serine/threonine protein kinase
LLENLATRQALLVFDNCEHLIQPCAELVEILLRECPRIRVLATSREALAVSGELAWIVPSLTMPQLDEAVPFGSLMEFDAIRLLVERAGLVRSAPAFELTRENAPIVAKICQRLDGIPLAVELAAARLKALTLDQVAARLDDRFSLLTTGSRTALPRQQTLKATMDWSYDLLPEHEKAMLRQLSVFAGGWTLEAGENICRPSDGSFLPDSSKSKIEGFDILDMLSNLVEKSLIVAEQKHETVRYKMLETIREYAREKRSDPEEDSAVRDRHLEIYLQLAEQVEPMLHADQVIWFDQLELELDNIRSATEWSMASNDDDMSEEAVIRIQAGLRMAGALGWFFEKRNQIEPLERLMDLLAKPQAAEQTKWRAKALNTAGFLNLTLGTLPEAEKVLKESMIIGRRLDDAWITMWALNYLGAVTVFQGDYAAAEEYLQEGLDLSRELGPVGDFGEGFSQTFLGDVYLYHEDLETAGSLYEESIRILRELKNHSLLAYSARRLGHLALRNADPDRAIELFRESLMLNAEVHHRQGIAACLAAFAGEAVVGDRIIRAAQLFGASESVIVEIAAPLYHSDIIEYDRNVRALRVALDDAAVAKAWGEGKRLPLEEAIAFALELSDTV